MVERCALSGSDLTIKFGTILLSSILVYILAPIPICLDGTIIDSSSTILVTMYLKKNQNACGYVGV